MDNKREHFCLSFILGMGIIAMCLGLLSINKTLAYDEESYATEWNVYFTEPTIKENDIKNTLNVSKNRINFAVTFTDYDESFTFMTMLKNDGDYDAAIMNFDTSDFRQKVLFSDADHDYYLSDFVTFSVLYANNNWQNKIKVDTRINEGDLILRNSYNKIIVKVHLLPKEKMDTLKQRAFEAYWNEQGHQLQVEGFMEAFFKQL